MGRRLAELPLFVQLLALFSLAALVPSAHAFLNDENFVGRIFLYGAVLGGSLALVIGLAAAANRGERGAMGDLGALVMSFALLPLFLAVPFHIAAGSSQFGQSWFEMVSSLTTTGATVYEQPLDLPMSLHLWRAIVGWLGGLIVWIAAFAILAPLNLGGFEVRSATGLFEGRRSYSQIVAIVRPADRLGRFAARLTPIYAGLTLALWLGLTILGEVPVVALCHAMSVLSTSGISPIGGTPFAASGVPGEMLIALFFVFALTRLAYSRGFLGDDGEGLLRDPELRLALGIMAIVTAVLFLRHMALIPDQLGEPWLMHQIKTIWGGLFTTLSFISTTGFESRYWQALVAGGEVAAPGIVLLGLALIGGGVATTAGGVKLLRVYALLRHGEREVERLVHPHSVGGAGSSARQIRKQGAQIAWVVLMLYALSLALILGALTLTGVSFDNALILSVAALTTTGPLAEFAGQAPALYGDVSDTGLAILGAAMILGRMEALALIALLNPELWRT